MAWLFFIATWFALGVVEDFLWFALNWHYPGSLGDLLNGDIWWHKEWVTLGAIKLPRFYLLNFWWSAMLFIADRFLSRLNF